MFRCSLKDKVGNLWFGTIGKGVYHYDAVSGVFTNFTKQDGLNDNHVEAICEDKAGNIWFGTEQGVCSYGFPKGGTAGKSFTNMSEKVGLLKYEINCITEDRNGNIWIGSNDRGASSYHPVSGVITHFTKEQGLGSNGVQCIFEDKAGNIWLGDRETGVCRYDSASGRFSKVYGEGCLSTQIMGMIEDKKGNIWFANLYAGVCYYDRKSFTHFTAKNGFCNDTVTCIYEDKKGNIWFGCGSSKWVSGVGGLCRYTQSTDKIKEKSFTSFGKLDGLASTDVWTIVEDNNGNLWVGTRGGLFRYHSPSGKFINYTHKMNRQ
jgi:ligand-binding sensor domain-containing protein